jgi:hypothetical protein
MQRQKRVYAAHAGITIKAPIQKGRQMKQTLTNFAADEDGAVTIDWVVLSAIVIGLGMVVLVPVAFSTTSSTTVVSDSIREFPVGYENN